MFYLVPLPDGQGEETRTHLYHMPLKEALRKRCQETKRRKQLFDASNNSKEYSNILDSMLRPCVKMLVTLSSVVLGCVILCFWKVINSVGYSFVVGFVTIVNRFSLNINVPDVNICNWYYSCFEISQNWTFIDALWCHILPPTNFFPILCLVGM